MNLMAETRKEDFAAFDYGAWLAWFDLRVDRYKTSRLVYDERPLQDSEAQTLGPSIAQFQLGEVSDGAFLIRGMTGYALKSGQDDLIPLAHKLVREARHHAFLLAEFMDHHSLKRVKTHPLNTCFRVIRRLGGVETMLSTLLLAELVATHYYQSLGHSTRSMMLKRICVQLLEDEDAHICLYRKLLWELRTGRSAAHRKVTTWIERAVFGCALVAVWPFHHKVYRRAGTSLGSYWYIYWAKFNDVTAEPPHSQEYSGEQEDPFESQVLLK
jgi:hypothetical protein